MAISWLNTEAKPKRISWLDDGSVPDFSNTQATTSTGRIGDVSQNSEVPRIGYIPSEEDVQSAPVRESLFARAADSASRMAQPLVSGITAPVIAGASAVPAQARAVAGGAQQAYADLTPDWMFFPLSGDKEIESIRQTVGDAGAARYARSQQEIAAIKEEALAKGADPFSLDAAVSAPTTAAMLGGSMINPALGLGLLTGITGPQSYAGFRAEGLSPSEAAQAAVAETAAEVVPSIVPAAAIARSARLGRAPAAVAVSAAESGQEFTTDALQQANRVALGLQDSIDLEQSGRAAGLGAALGAPFGAAAGRRIPVVETGIPVTDAAAQVTADIQEAVGVSVEPTGASSEATSPPTPTTPTSNAETAVQSVTERSRGIIPRSEKMRARLNLQTGQLETAGGGPIDAPSAADFERAEMATGIEMFRKRPQERARQRGVDVDGLLRAAPAQPETALQNAVPVAQPEPTAAAPETPSNSNYVRRAMQLANEEGIDATPEWLQQRVSQLQSEDVSEMAIRGGVSPSTLSYYTTAEEIPQEYRNTTPLPESQLPVVNAIKTATNAREAVDALRPLIQSETLRSFVDKIGTYIDLAEIPVITVNPEDAGRTDLGPANYLTAKGKERTVGAYSPATREIYLKGEGWKNNGMNAEALLHELQHAASVHVYEAVKRGTLTDERAVKAVADIEALASEFNANSEAFSSFPKETQDRLRYAASNPKEFMAITQTSPLVQSALKKEGLWKRFVNAIRNMFGYSRSETPLLERILTAGDEVMGAQQAAQLATAPPAAGTVVNEADYAPGDLSFDEMAITSQSTRERLREEEAQRSAKHYEDTPAWVKNTKRVLSWTGAKDVALAKQQEALTLQKAALGVPEREIAKRGDRIQSIIKREGLNSEQALLDVDNIIRGQPAPNANPKVAAEAKRIRSLVDGAQAELLQAMTASGADPRATEEMVDKIYDSIGSYISRSYLRSFYKPGPVARLMSRGREGSAWTKEMKTQRPELYQELVKFVDNNLVVPKDLSVMSDEAVATMAERYGIDPGEDVRVALAEKRAPWQTAEAMRNFLIEGLSAVSPNSPIKVVRQAARDEGILEKRQDVSKVIREWWGEITDPVTAAAITFDRIGTLAAETRFLNNIAAKGLGTYVFDSNNPAPTGESLVELNNAKLGPLNGKLVRTELKQFLDTQIGLTELKSADDWKELASMIGNNLIVRPGGIAKGMATVMSLPTMAMNVQSNIILAINDAAVMGLMSKLTPGDKYKDYTPDKLIKYSIQDVFNNINNTEQVKKLVSAGVLRDGISLGELRSTVRNLERKLRTEAATTRTAKLSGAINQKVQGFSEAMADFYQLSDNLPRLIAFSSNLGNLSRAFPDLNQKEIWDMAADRARDMTPTFGRASPTVKVPSKVLGNFATWMGEVVRTYAKRYDYALSDINRGRKEGNVRLAQFGLAQLTATSTSLVANALAIPAIIKLVGGAIGDDETEENIKQLAPEWLSDKNLIPREIDRENKRIFVWNTTRNDPAAPIQEVANRIDRSGEAGAEVASYIRDTVLQPGMYLEGLATAAFGYRRPTQSLLQGNELRAVEGADRVRPLVEAFNPGTARQAVRAVAQYNRGSDSTTQLERVLGLPIEEIDVPRVVTDKSYAYRNDKRAIEESLRTDLASPGPLTEDEFKAAVSEYLVDSQNLFEDLKGTLDAAKKEVGMTDAELSTILKEASGATNRGERARLIRGEFTPRKFTSEWLDGVEEKALRENVRDPAYTEQVKQEFRQRRRWLNEYLGSPRKWQPLLENTDGS